jgi:MoaA/NifB/PqqE/SkfB family radical SAM enzyme
MSAEIKYDNTLKIKESFNRGDFVVSGYPNALRIEISNICNLRCTFSKEAYGTCPHWTINKNPVLMSFEFFKRIIDEVGAYLNSAQLYNYGEPFTNPCATDMIRYLKTVNPEVFTEIHTNGHFFETERIKIDVLNSGLDLLLFSVDGITQEVYEKYRIGGNLELVTEAIRGICQLKKKMGINRPRILFQFILFEHNFHEAPNVKKFASDLGVDEIVIKTDLLYHKPDLKVLYADIYNSIFKLQSQDSADTFYKKDNNTVKSFCDFPWTYPTILADKRMVVCCRDGQYKSVVGSLEDKSFLEVWNGQGYQEFRKKFLEDKNKPIPCCLCECRPK